MLTKVLGRDIVVFYRLLVSALVLCSQVKLFAKSSPLEVEMVPPAVKGEMPWFTGPILAPGSSVYTKGHILCEPYVYATASSASYDKDWRRIKNPSSWNVVVSPVISTGLSDWMDISLNPSWEVNYVRNSSIVLLGDLNVAVDIQLLLETPDNYLPSLKLALRETFPIGPYDSLNPNNLGVDGSGQGCYTTGAALVISRLFHIRDKHWFDPRFTILYTVSSRAHVRGYNIYGGNFDTDGWVYFGQSCQMDFAFEWSFTQNWAIACDFGAIFRNSTKFSGNPGLDTSGNPLILAKGYSVQYSIAPAIEYNWSTNIGLISGVWTTLAGRNATAFTSWVTCLSCYY